MDKYGFDYTVLPDADQKMFEKLCDQLEKGIPGVRLDRKLYDVDDSGIAVYKVDDKELVVHNDYDVGALYVLSDVPIEKELLRV